MSKRKTAFQWQRDEPELEPNERPSRGEHKREVQARKELVKQLLSLSQGHREALPLSEELQEALEEALRLKEKRRGKSGYRRQLLLIAGLIRTEDVPAIQTALEAIR